MPPLDPDDPDTRERLATPRLLVLESRPDGMFLNRYDELGGDAGDTWHQSAEEAKEQALAEYGKSMGQWTEVPDGEADPVAFGFRLAEGAIE